MRKTLSVSILASAVAVAGFGLIHSHASAAFTPAEIAQHNGASDCWMSISGKVYNVTSFIPNHPGGNSIISLCGKDATLMFNAIHDQSAFAVLPSLFVGDLAGQNASSSVSSTIAADNSNIGNGAIQISGNDDGDDVIQGEQESEHDGVRAGAFQDIRHDDGGDEGEGD